ncbi:aspartyl-tRNA synthetase [Blattabacterium sp. (Periplaneta americana) str. BPLAN]|uniref:aspartate--tRNA ligase n=1 Tax=Blattabacterium sp. (Periplaneta americana) TaxID=367488 RepID=UPI0001BA0B01|nr:aspartate--tRNA ligase [Blattabacterium sp. (Periplaneta americana)]ACX83643.1 aspartyl-tRNA synthetase [Blattabacterium sp. (Periplaneta americana) str. BPLAN]
MHYYRTHNCGELCKKDIGKKVILSGWIQKIRNLGSLIFIDLRDFFGIIQLVFSKKLINKIELRKEFVIKISGEVIKRKSINQKIPTGEIEVLVSRLEILNPSIPLPFLIEDQTDGDEECRMKYRYLDIRRNPIKNNLILRHEISLETRNFLSKNGFLEIETPVLINQTPEGARSFVVPSRIHSGMFYALPQSPQLFKQLLMIGGIDKYFQIAKCFRDEDARSDRQIEFTQIDCEMAFVDVHDILIFFENFIKHLFKKIKNIELESFTCISYSNSMDLYGTDSPDLRFGMKFVKLNEWAQKKGIEFLKKKELTIGINVPKCSHYTCNQIYSIIEGIREPKINPEEIFWIKFFTDKTILSSKKLLSHENLMKLIKCFKAKPGDLLFIIFGKKRKTRAKLSKLRIEMAHHLNLKNPQVFKPLWIIDLPLLEWDEKSKRYKSFHHPFTSPIKEDIHLLDKKNPGYIRTKSYELIINGMEIGGGSIRVHDKNIQDSIFKHLGFSIKDIESEFGFLTKAFEYGTPPHGGIAFGLDRLITILEGKENIKDFIAFPKNNSGRDTMVNTPYFLKKEKLKELRL